MKFPRVWVGRVCVCVCLLQQTNISMDIQMPRINPIFHRRCKGGEVDGAHGKKDRR